MNQRKWTKEEDEYIKDNFGNITFGDMANNLGCCISTVRKRAKKLGLHYITLKKVYTAEELQYIKENWGVIAVNEMARKLGVSRNMIQAQADKMNLPKLGNNPYRKWTEEEIAKLEKLASKKSVTELAKCFNTTNDAVLTVAHTNGICLNDGRIRWTEEDNELLRELAKTLDLSEISIKMNRTTFAIRLQAKRQKIKIIPNDSIWTDENTKELQKLVKENKTLLEICELMRKKDTTILKKARELKLKIKKEEQKKWSNEEINRLKELSKTKKLSELVKEFNRTSRSIKEMAKRLGINIMSDRKNWTEDEYQLLEKLTMIDKKTPKEIADILGRSENAIIIKISRRGLKIQTNDKRFWTKEEEILLSDLWGTESFEMIAKKLNRTVSSIKNKAFSLGLGSAIENNYNGLTIKDISDLLGININTISVDWIGLGLKYKVQRITKSKSYRYVEIKDLYEFLEANQNIWDSRNLEKNILGSEPEWLKEKRIKDRSLPTDEFRLENLTKQQLLLAKQYFLDSKQEIESTEYKECTIGTSLIKENQKKTNN